MSTIGAAPFPLVVKNEVALAAVGIAVLWSTAVSRLFYGTGSGEHDTFMMAAGVVHAAQGGGVLNAFSYGAELQFLFYYLMRVVTYFRPLDADGVLWLMNAVGAVCSLAIPLLLLRILSDTFVEQRRAIVIVALFVTSPMYLYTASYGHPFHLALVVLLVSWTCLLAAVTAGATPRAWVAFSAAIVLQSAALMIRFEQVALVAVLLIGLLVLRPKRPRREWVLAGTAFAVALLAYTAARTLLVSPAAVRNATGAPSFTDYFSLLLLTFAPDSVRWGLAHLAVEVGLPLLALAAAAVVWSDRRRRPLVLVALAAAALPSVLVYLGNPSPPRHFYVLAAGMACVSGAALHPRCFGRLPLLAAGILLFNLAFPAVLRLADGRPDVARAIVTYNAIERTDRNRAQLVNARPFYEEVIAAAGEGPVVLLGSWVHIAQLSARLANEPGSGLGRATLAPGVSALTLRGPDLDLYLIETYDPRFAELTVATLRRMDTGVRFMSIVQGGTPVNDLNLHIPREIYWWSA